jgi:hypothetical protein
LKRFQGEFRELESYHQNCAPPMVAVNLRFPDCLQTPIVTASCKESAFPGLEKVLFIDLEILFWPPERAGS